MIKDLIRKVLRATGYELRRADAPLHSAERGFTFLAERIGNAGFVVVDIGVAEGTPELYAAFPSAKNTYLLVEANPAYRATLETLSAQLPAQVAPVFCGAIEGTIPFNIYADGRKSSAFETKDRVPERVVEVEVRALDGLLQSHHLQHGPVILKIDAEGAELDVLAGAEETLGRCVAIIAEAALAPRNKGGALIADLVSSLRERGFVPFDIIGGGVKGSRLQLVDIIFIPIASL